MLSNANLANKLKDLDHRITLIEHEQRKVQEEKLILEQQLAKE